MYVFTLYRALANTECISESEKEPANTINSFFMELTEIAFTVINFAKFQSSIQPLTAESHSHSSSSSSSTMSTPKSLFVCVRDAIRSLADDCFSAPIASLLFGLLNRCSVPSNVQSVVAVAPIAVCSELFTGPIDTKSFGDALFRLVRDLCVSTSSQLVPMRAVIEYLRVEQRTQSDRRLSEPLLCFLVGFITSCSPEVVDCFLNANGLGLISARLNSSLNSALELSLYPFRMPLVMISEALRSPVSSAVESQTLLRIQSLIRSSLEGNAPDNTRANAATSSAAGGRGAAPSSELQHLEQLCTVSSSTPGVAVGSVYLLLANTGLVSLQRRSSRAASFTHTFEASRQQIELTLEFPMQVLVGQVQVVSHSAGASGSPSAIALEVDGGEALCMSPVSTAGLVTFTLGFDAPVVVNHSLTLHLYRPLDLSAPLALSRISLLGHTVLTTPCETSSASSPALTQWLRLLLAALVSSSKSVHFRDALEHTFGREFLATLLHLYLLSAAWTADASPSEHNTLSKILQELLLLLNAADARLSDQLIPLFLEAIRGVALISLIF